MFTASSRFRSNIFIVLVAIGIIVLLANVSVLHPGSLLNFALRWWPLALAGTGVSILLRGRSVDFNRALFLLLVGGFLQCIMLGFLPSDLLLWWPLFSLILGFWLLLVQPRNTSRTMTVSAPVLRHRATLSGTRVNVLSGAFVDGSLTVRAAILECDFTRCIPAPAPLVLDVSILGGSITLDLPTTWHVTSDITVTLGSLLDERAGRNPLLLTETPQLHIRGSATIGVILLRNAPATEQENTRD